jgi:hypothetical protein
LLDGRYLKTNDFYKRLDKLISRLVGHKLFTLMVIDQSGKYVERVYSNNKKIYPLLGTKSIPANEWTKQVLIEKKEFLGSNYKQIKKLFFDHETIKSIGCGSIINLPVISNNKVLGTLNILHKENYYNKTNLKNVRDFAQLLSPYFISHQIKMKK